MKFEITIVLYTIIFLNENDETKRTSEKPKKKRKKKVFHVVREFLNTIIEIWLSINII